MNQIAAEPLLPPRRRVLLMDSAPDLGELLSDAAYDVEWIETPAQMMSRVKQLDFDVALLDIDQSDRDTGLGHCRQLVTSRPETPVVVITRQRDLETVVGAIRSGAYDFVARPIHPDQFQRTVARAMRHRELRSRLRRLSAAAQNMRGFEELIGESASMRNLFELIRKVAATDAGILIAGESGTGKEIVAKAIHKRSSRSERPFVGVNCGAVPANLLESELFGHVKGAFTSARASRAGLFVHADGGTVLLDEIGEMPLEMQPKLLRVLQERTVRPVGGDSEVPFDARIIAATNRDLADDVRKGTFRDDLYYRINVVQLDVPPLRDRGNDVLTLARHFIQVAAEEVGRPTPTISSECARRLSHYPWPGNVRELENAIERAVALTSGEQLVTSDLPPKIAGSLRSSDFAGEQEEWNMPTLSEVECSYIHHVLEAMSGNKTRAAEVLGLDRRTLYRRLAKFDRNAVRASEPDSQPGPGVS